MSSPTHRPFTVAIIGAGLSGLGLALALHAHNINCTIYEAASTPEGVAKGSLQIAPNGQAALDAYGLWNDLAERSRFYQNARVMKGDGTLINEIPMGDKAAFGYDSMRIVRRTLITRLADTVRQRGMEINCDKIFVRVVEETNGSATVEFADGTMVNASLVIGADGIYSRLRRAMYPDVELQYIGSIAVGGSVSASKISGLEDKPYGMYLSSCGSAMMGPQVPDDSEYVAFVGKPYPDLGREGWKNMFEDKKQLRRFLAEHRDQWPVHVQDAIANISDEELWLWPMYKLPELKSWSSAKGRVLLIGDAAHAMPPTAGQGANMAFEDGYTLGLVLGYVTLDQNISLDSALQYWQESRKARINLVLEMTMQWAKMREPPNTKNEISKYKSFEVAKTQDERIEQMRWLYGGIEVQRREIEAWASSQS